MARYTQQRRSSLTLSTRPTSLPSRFKGLLHQQILDPIAKTPSGDEQAESAEEPLCDDVPDVVQLVNSAAATFERRRFERLPQLSRTVDPAFLDLLSRKINICCSKCDFSSPNTDNENKEIKTATLTEFYCMYHELKFATRLPMDVHMQIFSMCKTNIIRQIPIVDPRVLSSDSLPKFQDLEMMHLSLCYKILKQMISVCDKTPLINMEFVVQLLKLFSAPDMNEREELAALLYSIYQIRSENSQEILNRVGLLLMEYKEKVIPPFCVVPSLIFLFRVFNNPNQPVSPVFYNVYKTYVLPLLSTQHLVLFFSPFNSLATSVASMSASMARIIIEHAVCQWPSTKPSKQECFVNLVTDVLCHLGRKDIVRMAKPIFRMYEMAAHSTARVVEASFRIWNTKELRPKLLEYTKVIFPLVFSTYVSVSKTHWNTAIQTKALAVLKIMHSLDSKTYDELVARMTHLAPQSRAENNRQKKWAIIARAAAFVDRDVNISQILGEIQMQFNASRITQSVASMTKSTPRVVIPAVHGSSPSGWR